MQNVISSSKLFIIPNHMLSNINGGADEPNSPSSPSPTITIFGGGSENGAGGTVVGSLPISSNTTVTTYINANTATGVSGGGVGVTYQF